MDMVATANSSGTNRLIQRALSTSDTQGLAELFDRHRERLRKMIRLRLDWRLRGRVSSSSVLELVYGDVCRRINEYPSASGQTFFLWLRAVAGRVIDSVNQQHVGDRSAQAEGEISLYRGSLPEVTAASMAAQLLGDRAANQAAVRAEMLVRLQPAVNGLDPMDREILALRNLEELSADETAAALGLTKGAATIRYLQAVKRLNEILGNIPGFFGPGRG